MTTYNSNTIIKNVDNAIKSLEIETTSEGSYLKVKDLLGRSKYISDKGLVDKIGDASVIATGSFTDQLKTLAGYDPNENKVLVSETDGTFSWKTPSSGGFSNGFSNGFN